MIEHQDDELDELITRFGAEYNAPPQNPPLDAIRSRVHAKRASRTGKTRWIWSGAIAAGLVIAAFGLVNLPSHDSQTRRNASIADSSIRATRNALDESSRQANEILEEALEQAEAAAKAHPNDPFFARHMSAMRENANHFRELQNRGSQGAT